MLTFRSFLSMVPCTLMGRSLTASRLRLADGGWACAVMDEDGMVIVAAHGAPPPWIQGIEGAEAWALFQALLVTLPSLSRYWPDCLPVYLATQKGPEAALDPRTVLARIHGMLLIGLEDAPSDAVGWMPSHLMIKDLNLQLATKSDETLVGRMDLEGNKLADELAKRGVEFHRVTTSDVKIWREHIERGRTRAMWIGIATAEANDFASFPSRTPRRLAGELTQHKGHIRMRGVALTAGRGSCRWAEASHFHVQWGTRCCQSDHWQGLAVYRVQQEVY